MSTHDDSLRGSVMRGSTLGFGVVLAFALTVGVNYLAARHYQRFDWTRSKLYTLSEKSLNILNVLDQPVDAVVFIDPGSEVFQPVKELLARYADATPRITVKEIDPVKNRVMVEKLVADYQIERANVVVFVGQHDRRVVEAADLAEYDYSGAQYGQAPKMTGFKGEQLFTGAILELMEEKKPKLVFTSGHGEASVDDSAADGLSQARDFLGKDNFEIEEWPSLGARAVPDGADLVVIAGPTRGFTPPELDLLDGYLDGGGRVLLLLDPSLSEAGRLTDTGMLDWLAGYGVALGDDIVVDPERLLPFFSGETIFANDYGSHMITKTLEQAGLASVFSLARSVGPGDDIAGVSVMEIVRTSPAGWGETDLAGLPNVEKGDDDLSGPVPLAVVVQLESMKAPQPTTEPAADGDGSSAADIAADPPGGVDSENGDEAGEGASADAEEEWLEGGRMVVFGDSDFARNTQLSLMGNGTLVANTMNWLVEREAAIGISAKTPEQVRLSLTQAELSSISWLVLGLLPGLGIVAGVMVQRRRRR